MGMAQLKLFTHMIIVWNVFLCLKVIHSLLSHKNSRVVPLNILWIIPQTIDSGDSELEGENNIL